MQDLIKQAAIYVVNHWGAITASLGAMATIIIHRGGIKPIAESLWDSRPKQTTPPQVEAK